MIRSLKTILAAALLISLAMPASANPRVNVQVFRPAAHYDDLYTVMTSTIAEHMRWSAAFLINFGKNPLVFVDTGGETSVRQEVIRNQLTADVMGSLSLFDRLSVGLAIPLFVLNEGQSEGFIPISPTPSSFAFGDIRISPKVGILMRDEGGDGFGLAGELGISLPTGQGDSFVSDGFLLHPTVIADFRAGPVLVAVNLGFRVRFEDERLPFDVEIGSEFTWKVGARYDILPDQLQVIGELYGASSDYSAANNTHVEGVIGARYTLPDTGLSFTLGGGSGFTKGYGNTKFRVFAGIAYSPAVNRDQDGDGILDEFDQCPLEPEDFDGFQDEDGCPDPDNDGDGICDPWVAEQGLSEKYAHICRGVDTCPNEPETFNGFEDDDGCPDETLAKVDQGRIVIKQAIYFDTGRATIKPESFPVLRAVEGILRANPSIARVSIEGHTDDVGAANANRKLSQARSESVRQWLVDNGIAAERLSAIGYGEDRPAVVGRTREARELNRRVEFIILEPSQD